MGIGLLKFLDNPWDLARGYLREDLDKIEMFINSLVAGGNGTIAVPPVIAPDGSIISVIGARPVIFLGGSASESTYAPDTVTWVPVVANSASRQTIDTTERGTTAGIIQARIHLEAGSATLRYRNVTDNVTVGSGTPNAADVVYRTIAPFPVTLTPGIREYELQWLSSVGDTNLGLGSAYLV